MPSSPSLYDSLASAFADRLTSPWLIEQAGGVITYQDLEDRSAAVAAALVGLDVAKGDRVCVHVDKSAAALVTYFGVLRAGAVYLPLNVAYQADEVGYFLGDAKPAVAIGRSADEPWFSEVARREGVPHTFVLDGDDTGSWVDLVEGSDAGPANVDISGDDPAAILYTSGTTGRSKGAVITHKNLVANALSLHEVWGFRDDDVLLHALPIFHVHGLFVSLHPSMLSGIPIRLHTRFDAAAVIDDLPNATVFMGVPTMYTRLLATPGFDGAGCASIRLFTAGSAPLLPETFHAVASQTGHKVVERYGMTETGIITSNLFDGERKVGTVGPSLPGVEVRIADESDEPVAKGEVGGVQLRGDNVFAGYWRMPEKTASEFTADGWFRTGDIGSLDDDEFVHLVGRSKDLVISGGFNVYPKEVELLIDELPSVVESAVIGVYHADFGEAVVAVVVGDGIVDEQAVIDSLKFELASFKVPKAICQLDELPRNAMGKVQKNLLREQFDHLFRD